jgi:tRNA dimethylallyltransferase
MDNPARLLCIMGPTGAGKTAAALALAAHLPCSVVNADSRQVYRDFPIITAQPSARERAQCPHLLYGCLDTRQKLGAGQYGREAAAIVKTVCDAARTPLLAGGTGLYFRALLEGIAPIPHIPREAALVWRRRCELEGSAALHHLLHQVDPAYAAKIHENDRQRILRALEVWQVTGKTFTAWHERPLPPAPYRTLKIGIRLPLAELEPILSHRIDAMIDEGAVNEAKAALARCADPDAPGWSGIGCRELYLHCTGSLSLDACRRLWQRNTRAYAKRQLTWFRADRDIHWFKPWETEEIVRFCLRRLADDEPSR